MAEYAGGERFHLLVEETPANALSKDRRMHYCARLERLSLAHRAVAAIRMAQDNAAEAIRHMKSVVGLRSQVVHTMAFFSLDRPSPQVSTDPNVKETPKLASESPNGGQDVGTMDKSSPFVVAPLPPDQTGANEPSKDAQAASKASIPPMANKYLHGAQWSCAEVCLLFRLSRGTKLMVDSMSWKLTLTLQMPTHKEDHRTMLDITSITPE